MTATIAAVDVDVTVKRADGRWASRNGDEPASPDYLKHMADAVRPLLGQPVDDGQVQQLLDDKQRLADLADELRKQAETRGKIVERQARELTALKQDLNAADADARRRVDAAASVMATPLKSAQDEVDRLSKALTLRTNELDEARAERDTARAQLRDHPAPDTVRQKLVAAAADVTVKETLAAAAGEVAQLKEQLAAANRDLAAANRTLDEIADEQGRPCGNHHRYSVDLESGQPGPCECGQPWIRDFVEDDEPVALDVEPLTALFGQIRAEAETAGWKA